MPTQIGSPSSLPSGSLTVCIRPSQITIELNYPGKIVSTMTVSQPSKAKALELLRWITSTLESLTNDEDISPFLVRSGNMKVTSSEVNHFKDVG